MAFGCRMAFLELITSCYGGTMKQFKHFKVLSILLVTFLFVSGVFAGDYPLRSEYPTAKPITTKELNRDYNNYYIVDVRSRFEFDVIHIKKAKHISISKRSFPKLLEQLVGGNKSAKIAFYCNGITCAKSYKACKKANEMGYTNARVHDDGIFTWTEANPSKSVLLGKSPVKSSDLIPKSKLNKHMLAVKKFTDLSKADTSVLFDLRDPIQRAKNPAFPKKSVKIDMDRFVKNLSKDQFREKKKKKTILMYDAVGKQVRWLQYYLEANGFKNYYFLSKGAWSIFGAKGATK